MKENNVDYHKLISEVEDYAFLVLDANGNITDWNKGAEKLKGYTEEEIIGQNFKIFYTQEDRRNKLPEKLMAKAAMEGKALDEGWRVRKDGSCFWGSILITALRDASEDLTGYLKITRDLTERKALEEKLKSINEDLEIKVQQRAAELAASQLQFRNTLDNMFEGAQMHDFDWRYIYVNDAFLRFRNYRREDLLGRTLMDNDPGIEDTDLFRTLKQCMDERIARRTEAEYVLPNGTRLYFDLSIQPIPEGIFILSVDITEKKIAEEALQNTIRELTGYKYAIDESAIVARTDRRGIINHVNEKFCEISQYSQAELLGQDHRIINSAFHPKEYIHELWSTILKGGIWKGELRNRAKDGTCYWVDTTIVPFMNDEGKPYQFMAIRSDITQRKKAEENLLKINRLYAFLSAINQSIVHAQDEQELFDKVCDIALSIGRFKLAWIGMLDDKGKLDIVSLSGDKSAAENVLKQSGVDYVDPALQDMPTIKVLRTGRYSFNNDVQNDPALSPWRDHFVSHGIAAKISLPITKFGSVVGVYGLHASQRDFFDDAEIALLEEAAGDISFALEVFDKEERRKQAEAVIKKNEERLERAQAVAHLGSWQSDLTTGVSTWSDETCRIFGVPVEENKQSTALFLDFVHPDDLPYVKGIIASTSATFTPASFDHRIVRRDGSIRHIHTERRFEYDEQGQPTQLYGICLDVTDQMIADENLRRNESKLRDAQALASMGSWEIDMVNNKLYWSDEQYRILGYEVGEIAASNEAFLSMVHPDDQDMVNAGFQSTFQTFENGSNHFRMIRKDGAVRNVFCEWKFDYDAHQRPIRIHGIVHDITERKKAENKIQELNGELLKLNGQLSIILNTLPANIALLDKDGTIIVVNEAWNKFGRDNNIKDAKCGLGDNYIEVCSQSIGADEEAARSMAQGVIGVLNGELTEFKLEYPCHSPDEERWFRVEVRPLSESEQDGAVVMHINITDSKKAEREIVALNEHLEVRVASRTAELTEANKALEFFSYSVSHDLRSPVRVIIGFASIIRNEYLDSFDTDLKELFGHIEANAKRLNIIIDDMLTLAKYEKTKLRPVAVDMNQVVKIVWDHLLVSQPHHAILHMDTLPAVQADLTMIEQVLVNLLSNAVKYSSKKEQPAVTVGYELSDGIVTFSIRDNGAGFDMKNYNKLFGAFQRLHGMDEFEGTGVGLLLAKRIIEKHGGKIWAEGKVDEGAVFYFTLPVAISEQE